MKEKRLFYRVGVDTAEGLWYTPEGEFIGKIHDEFKWLKASALEMPYDEEVVGYLSVADDLEHLHQWFGEDEIVELQKQGFKVFEYEATDWKFYEPYQHNLINQKTSVIKRIIEYNKYKTIDIVREASRIAAKDVRLPKVIRDGIVKLKNKNK
jgi:hypothetical protein